MKGNSEQTQTHCTKFMSADFMADSGTAMKKKKDVRFTLRYEDGKIALPDRGGGEVEMGHGGGEAESEGEERGSEEERGGNGDEDSGEEGEGSESDEEEEEEGELSEEEGEEGDEWEEGGGDTSEEESSEEDDDGDVVEAGIGYGSDLDSDASEEETGERNEARRKRDLGVVEKSASEELPYTFSSEYMYKLYVHIIIAPFQHACMQYACMHTHTLLIFLCI